MSIVRGRISTRLALRGVRAWATLLNSPATVRPLMVGSLPRLARHRERAPRAVARALRTVALGRIPIEEREWAARIESRRRALYSQEAIAQPFVAGLPENVSAATWCVSVSALWASFLMRLVRELSPQSCLEVGTGLGISAAYQAAALDLNGAGRLITLEGSTEWAEVAKRGVSALGLGRVQVEVGPIAETLPRVLGREPTLDYVFLDAEHTEEATVGYFASVLPHLSEQAVVVIDDVPNDRETRRAWRTIARYQRVSAALVLGRMGVVVVSSNAAQASSAGPGRADQNCA